MRILLILIIISSLFSCSPEKRLARLVSKHPELIKHDTIFKLDTTIVNGVQHDTIFKTEITKDTVTIIDKQLTIKYYNDGKTTYIKGVCDTVFVVKEIPVIVNSVNPVMEVRKKWYWRLLDKVLYPFAFLGLLALIFIVFDQISAKRK